MPDSGAYLFSKKKILTPVVYLLKIVFLRCLPFEQNRFQTKSKLFQTLKSKLLFVCQMRTPLR